MRFMSPEKVGEKMARNSAVDVMCVYGKCSICSIDNDNKEWIMITPCFHRFHSHCFGSHLSSYGIDFKLACPKCDGEVGAIKMPW